MGGKNEKTVVNTASTSVEHVVEVTAKRRFWVTSVSNTDIQTKNGIV